VIPTLDQSGAEKQFSLLACRLPPNEFQVKVVALNRGGPYEAWLQEHNIPYEILQKRWRLDVSSIRKLRREIQAFRPDVVLSCLFSANTSVRLATLGMKDPPAVLISERCVDSWKSGWQLWLDRKLAPRTTRLIANSQSVADFYGQVGFPRDKITVIPNGIETPARPELSREDFLRKWNLPADARIAMYVGRLAAQKNLKTLIWATQVLRQADPRAYVLLVGDGPLRADLEQYARDVESFSHIRFLGHQDRGGSLLHHCDVFWLASSFEGMSNSVMEAMACGKPVIVSDIPPNRELVTHDAEGYLIDLGDSAGYSQYTGRIFAEPELADRLGQAARSKMEDNFSVDQMLERYAQTIRENIR